MATHRAPRGPRVQLPRPRRGAADAADGPQRERQGQPDPDGKPEPDAQDETGAPDAQDGPHGPDEPDGQEDGLDLEGLPEEPLSVFFGEPWYGPPYMPNRQRVLTPVGTACAHCRYEVREGDQGLMQGTLRVGPHGGLVCRSEPFHRECVVRMGVGPLAHLDGTCICAGGTARHDFWPGDPLEAYLESVEVFDRVLGGLRGHGRRAGNAAQ